MGREEEGRRGRRGQGEKLKKEREVGKLVGK